MKQFATNRFICDFTKLFKSEFIYIFTHAVITPIKIVTKRILSFELDYKDKIKELKSKDYG